MSVTSFIDLPDLVILNILRYLSSFDAIQAFYHVDNHTERILNLLIEHQCFSSIYRLRLPLFNFVCDHVLPRIGTKLSHLTLYDHQLLLARQKQILLYLPNILSLHLINIVDIIDNNSCLSYFLHKQLRSLTINFISEHNLEAQAYVCEQFIFNKKSENLIYCHLMNDYGINLRHLTLFPNYSIENMTIQLKQLSDLHVIFDHLINIKILNVEIYQWTIEDIKYDYAKLSTHLSHLSEFSLQTNHVLNFTQIILIIRYLIHLKKLSFIYRNYDEHGIDISQLELTLNYLYNLKEFHFVIQFIYFNLNSKSKFENYIEFKQQWNVHTYINASSFHKNYFAYTQPFIYQNCSISTDILLNDTTKQCSSVTNLNLTIHTKQLSILPIICSLNRNYSSVTHLHLADSFGIENDNDHNINLPKIHSFDATELKISKPFQIFLDLMPNLTHLNVNINILIDLELKSLLRQNKIKYLELITNKSLEQINNVLYYFLSLEQLVINSKKQSSQLKRKFVRNLFDWFDICSQLYTIHVKAHKLSDLFYLVHIEDEQNMHVQYSNEMLTVWK